ncbi:MAG: DUF4178 domain-containing protein [Capsulimonadales bacterium]|nr:DUF4178 domain-containing protein [Capsulimonadales bacterium]
MPEPSETTCPACGGFAFLPSSGRSGYVCARCGKEIPARSHFARPGDPVPHRTPLRVGMKAQLAGRTYFLVAIVAYRQTVRNTDTGTDENYFWQTFVLLTSDGEERYLEFEAGKWLLAEPTEPAGPESVRQALKAYEGMPIPVFGRMGTVRDCGTCEVTDIEGALPWPVRVGQSFYFADVAMGGDAYGFELKEDTGEAEWYRCRSLDDREVLTWFGLDDLLRKEIAQASRARAQRNFGWYVIGMAFFAFAGFFLMPNTGTIIAQGTTGGVRVPEEGLRFGPFALKETVRPSRFRLSAGVPNNRSTWAQGVIETPEGKPLFGLDGEFWAESGYDDGYWSESVTAAQQEYHLDKPRQVFVRVFTDPEGPNGTELPPGSPEIAVFFSIEEGVACPSHLLWFGFPALGIGLIALAMASVTAQKKVWES